MQDSNTENTTPMRPDRAPEETVPVRPYPPGEAVTGASRPQGAAIYPAADAPSTKVRAHRRRWPWVVLGILMIFLFAGAGTWMGYQSALQLRQGQEEEQRVNKAKEHFMAGLVAQANGQHEMAKTQFEYVIRLDPTFPGAQDKLREVLLAMSIARTPTPAPTVATPTLTPTPDTRPQEDIYATALQQYAAQDWAGLFATVDSLRRIDPNYRAVEIDGMLYMALRFRGIDKMLKEANLEGGLYDLALAERFGPLDEQAKGYRTWARMYLNGASFWEVDWPRVMQYFEEIYPHFPNMRDSSGLTAIERYRIAATSQGDLMMTADKPCEAYEYYQKSLNAVVDAAVQTKADEAYLLCYPPEPTAEPTLSPTPTLPVQPTAPVEPTQPPVEASPTTAAPPTQPAPEATATPAATAGDQTPAP